MTELMSSGVELMLIGMGIVYVFLALLVIVITFMSSLIQRFFPEASPVSKKFTDSVDHNTVAAISAVVHRYRSQNK